VLDQPVGDLKAVLIERLWALLEEGDDSEYASDADEHDDGFEDAEGDNDEDADDDVDQIDGSNSGVWTDPFFVRFAFNSEAAAHTPRPYQRDAVQEIHRRLKPGPPGLIHVATGGGISQGLGYLRVECRGC